MKMPKQVYTLFIRTTPKKAWDAITKPEFTRQFWGNLANVSDWKEGSKWEHMTKENEAWIVGTVTDVAPAVEALRRTMEKIYRDRGIVVEAKADPSWFTPPVEHTLLTSPEQSTAIVKLPPVDDPETTAERRAEA